jgi:hypothetical protein
VRFSLRQLYSWVLDVARKEAWFKTVGVDLVEVDAEQTLNAVEVSYRGDQATESQILARFGNPDWMQFDYRGPGPWTGPVGDVELKVFDANGRPAAYECLFTSLDPRFSSESPPREIFDGKCFQQALPAIRWRVDITYERDGQRHTVSREFSVPDSGIARLRVNLEQ